jgi:hypothetical protein
MPLPRITLRTWLFVSLGLNAALVALFVFLIVSFPMLFGALTSAQPPRARVFGAMMEKRLGGLLQKHVADPVRLEAARNALKSGAERLSVFVENNSGGKKQAVSQMVLSQSAAESSRGAELDLSYYLAQRNLMVSLAKSVFVHMTPAERDALLKELMAELP